MAAAGDPVGTGFVASLARPGGNVTGLTNFRARPGGKRLELLKEVVPKLSRVAVLWDPTSQSTQQLLKRKRIPARALGVQLQSIEVRGPNDLDKALRGANKGQAGALTVLTGHVVLLQTKTDRGACRKEPAAGDLSSEGIRRWRWLMAYGADRSGPVPARRHLCR